MMSSNIKEQIKLFPKSPGVYQFMDKSGDILYVGKAKNLFSRIRSYFLKEIGRGPSIDIMVQSATQLKYIETESEIEAILLEAELIKSLKPKYNIRLKDDRSFLVIRIVKPRKIDLSGTIVKNYDEQFSCLELIRFKNADLLDKSAWYFGPYPSGELLKKSLNYLRKIFPFRDCSKTKFATYRKKGRPCIYGDIRVCTAPCNDWVDRDQYQKNVNFLMNFLRGKKKSIVSELEKEMKELSKQKRFEEAALVRDKIGALDHLKDVAIGIRDDIFNGDNILFKRIECYDISNIGGDYAVGSMVVFSEGKADKAEYKRFKIREEPGSEAGQSDLSRLKEVLERRFKNDWLLPDLVVIDGGEMQLKVAKEVLEKFELAIPVVSIAKGPKRDKNEFHFGDLNIARYINHNKNLINVIISARDESHRFAISYYRLLHKKDMFK